MARELNRDLFGGRNRNDLTKPETDVATPAQPVARAEEVRVLHLHIESLVRRLKELESRIDNSHSRIEELSTQTRGRFERVQSHFQRQTEMFQNALSDIHSKIAQVVSRVNERRVNENMVKEMVERHTQAVQTFEVRLTQMQKVIHEQEMHMMHARSELKEALQELARIKKGT